MCKTESNQRRAERIFEAWNGRVHPLFTLCVPTWPVKTAFNSSQFTRLLRKEERNPEDVRRPESSETRNGFLRFRRWQDERRVICLLSVDDKARSSPTPLCSSSQNSPRSSPESKGESSPLFLGARVSLCEGYQRGSTSTAGRSAIL